MAPLKVLVFGITGAQGGSVAKYLLEEPDKYKLFGLTRHTDSGKSKDLKSKGVEMIAGDLDDPSSYEEALKKVDAVFLNTNWWQWYNPETDNAEECIKREKKQATDVADAMKRLGTKYLCYSTLGEFEIKGKAVPHCYSKVLIEKHINDIGLKASFVEASYYMSNVLGYPNKKNDDGTITIQCPLPDDATIPQTPIEQLGLWVRLCLSDPEKWAGEKVHAVTDKLTVKKITEILSDVTGKKFVPMHVTREWFDSEEARKPNPELHLNSYVMVDDLVKPDIPKARSLVKGSWDFKEWALNAGGVEEKWGLKK